MKLLKKDMKKQIRVENKGLNHEIRRKEKLRKNITLIKGIIGLLIVLGSLFGIRTGEYLFAVSYILLGIVSIGIFRTLLKNFEYKSSKPLKIMICIFLGIMLSITSSCNSSENSGSNSSVRSSNSSVSNNASVPVQIYVWISATGSKYHNKPNCGNMNANNATKTTKEKAEFKGYTPCKKCYK